MKSFDQELDTAKKLARKAGQAIMEIYKDDVAVKYKAKGDPVTIADITANKIIIESLKRFNYGILSEESADNKLRLEKDRVWIIDPLDGTKDFINKTGEFTIMIGLAEKGESVLGVVYNPVKDILYYAEKGKGAFIQLGDDVKTLEVSKNDDVKEARMLVSRHHLGEAEGIIAKNLGIKKIIPCGSAGLKIALVAASQGELNINASSKTWEWDLCAVDIILKEAGGKLTDIKGNKFIYNKEDARNLNGYVASNKLIHRRVLGELAKIN